jgi:predicted dehydrogenase
MTPVQLIAAELRDFHDCVKTRRPPAAGAINAGVLMADIVEGIYASAQRRAPVDLVQ